MKKSFILEGVVVALLTGSVWHAQAAATVSLADWCVNVNGNVAAACNGAGSGGSGVSLAGFDSTLEPGSNSLGSVTVTLGAGNNQFVAFYADYDVDFAKYGSFADYATLNGVLPAGGSYEIDDPNTSNIFSDFTNNALNNLNNVGTPSIPPGICCDVSFAIGVSGLNVPGGGETITFNVTNTAPATGFYIQQTNEFTNDSIYLQEFVFNVPQTTSPEPPTYVLGLALLGLGAGLRGWRGR